MLQLLLKNMHAISKPRGTTQRYMLRLLPKNAHPMLKTRDPLVDQKDAQQPKMLEQLNRL